MTYYTRLLPILFATLLLGSCHYTNGTLTLTLTDAPADNATSVVVEITGIEAIPADGNPIDYNFPQPQQIDLLQLQHGLRTPLLSNWHLPAGQYQALILTIKADGSGTDSYITLDDGSQHALQAPPLPPDGISCGAICSSPPLIDLSINTGFNISAAADTSYVIDFDARKSVLPPAAASTAYQLQSTGRMVAETNAGNIIGTVPSTFITAGCTPVVYVYAGINGNPADLDNTAAVDTQPVTESAVTLNNNNGQYAFTAAYLPAGQYTLAFTCAAAQDNPATADNISFTSVSSLFVSAGQTSSTGLQ